MLLALSLRAETTVRFDLNAPFFNAFPASNRVVTLQALTPFPGNLVTYTSDVSGVFYASNAFQADYAGMVTRYGSAAQIPFQITVTSTNLGVVSADTITSQVGIQTYPTAGRSSWTIQAAERRYGAGNSNGQQVAVSGPGLVAVSNGVLTTISLDGSIVNTNTLNPNQLVSSGGVTSIKDGALTTNTVLRTTGSIGLEVQANQPEADIIYDEAFTGYIFGGAGYFPGGLGNTPIPGSQINSGTISAARLATNTPVSGYALKATSGTTAAWDSFVPSFGGRATNSSLYAGNTLVANIGQGILISDNLQGSVDWYSRQLLGTNGAPILDWSGNVTRLYGAAITYTDSSGAFAGLNVINTNNGDAAITFDEAFAGYIFGGSISADSFSGNLNGSQVTSGTVNPARLATNTPVAGLVLQATSGSTAAWLASSGGSGTNGTSDLVTFTNIPEMIASSSTNTIAYVKSYWGTNDIGGGFFRFDTNSATTNFGTIFQSAAGYRHRIVNSSNELYLRWFGVRPMNTDDLSTLHDSYQRITNAIAVTGNRAVLWFPPFGLNTSQTIVLTNVTGLTLKGEQLLHGEALQYPNKASWIAYSGPSGAGTAVIRAWSAIDCTIDGIGIETSTPVYTSGAVYPTNNAQYGIIFDQANPYSQICTRNQFKNLSIRSRGTNVNFVGLAYSIESLVNCEAFVAQGLAINGGGNADVRAAGNTGAAIMIGNSANARAHMFKDIQFKNIPYGLVCSNGGFNFENGLSGEMTYDFLINSFAAPPIIKDFFSENSVHAIYINNGAGSGGSSLPLEISQYHNSRSSARDTNSALIVVAGLGSPVVHIRDSAFYGSSLQPMYQFAVGGSATLVSERNNYYETSLSDNSLMGWTNTGLVRLISRFDAPKLSQSWTLTKYGSPTSGYTFDSISPISSTNLTLWQTVLDTLNLDRTNGKVWIGPVPAANQSSTFAITTPTGFPTTYWGDTNMTQRMYLVNGGADKDTQLHIGSTNSGTSSVRMESDGTNLFYIAAGSGTHEINYRRKNLAINYISSTVGLFGVDGSVTFSPTNQVFTVNSTNNIFNGSLRVASNSIFGLGLTISNATGGAIAAFTPAKALTNVNLSGLYYDATTNTLVNLAAGGIASNVINIAAGSRVTVTTNSTTLNTINADPQTNAILGALAITGAITNVVAGSNATVQIANGIATVNAIPGGGSQTPWTGNINGAGYSLTNANFVTATNIAVFGYVNMTGNSISNLGSIQITNLNFSMQGLGGARQISIKPGNGGSDSSTGGSVDLTSGDNLSGTANGATLSVNGADNRGGYVDIRGGNSDNTGGGGDISLIAGNFTGSSGDAGDISITAGSKNPSTTGAAGNVTITAGSNGTVPGNVFIEPGFSDSSGVGTNYIGKDFGSSIFSWNKYYGTNWFLHRVGVGTNAPKSIFHVGSGGSTFDSGITNNTLNANEVVMTDANKRLISTNALTIGTLNVSSINFSNSFDGTNIYWSTNIVASPTNSLTLYSGGGYALLQTFTPGALTNLAGIVHSNVTWCNLSISNASSSNITFYVNTAKRLIGSGSTNAIVIPSGKIGEVTVKAYGTKFTNIVTAVEQ